MRGSVTVIGSYSPPPPPGNASQGERFAALSGQRLCTIVLQAHGLITVIACACMRARLEEGAHHFVRMRSAAIPQYQVSRMISMGCNRHERVPVVAMQKCNSL